MATAEEAGPSRAGGRDHECSRIHEPVGPHTVAPFKQRLLQHQSCCSQGSAA